MFKLSKLNLQFPLCTRSTQGKNIKNQTSPVDHATFEFTLEISFLRRRQLVIENHQIGINRRKYGSQFLNLALTREIFRVRTMALSENLGNHNASCRLRKQSDFFDLVIYIRLTKIQLNDDRTFTCGWSFIHLYFREMK